MARKVRGFERVLDAPALFAVAYDEIGSSIYFALGIVAAQALGLTPVVLLATGLLFLVVSLSYAEGTAAIPETGGAATFTRRAFNDLAGFATGWVLFLDFLIVIALSSLFLPHYLAASLSAPSLTESPWDVVIAVAVDRRDRRSTTRPPQPDPRGGAGACRARHLGAAARRRPRLRDRLLTGGPDERIRLRGRAGLARPLLRAAACDARVHGARDRRQPRRGDAGAGQGAAALAVLVDRPGRDRDGPDRNRRRVGFPGRGRLDRSRRRMAPGADRRDRDGVRRASALGSRRRPARRRRSLGSADPVRCGDDRDHGLHPARAIDGRARDAAPRVRTARAALARLAGGARRHGADRDRDRRRDGDLRRGRPGVPGQRLLVRRAVRVHRRSTRRDQAPSQGARSRAPLQGQAGGADSRCRSCLCRR